MATKTKTKYCRFRGKELTEEDPISRKQCTGCSFKRMRSWLELQAEAKRQFDEKWPIKEEKHE